MRYFVMDFNTSTLYQMTYLILEKSSISFLYSEWYKSSSAEYKKVFKQRIKKYFMVEYISVHINYNPYVQIFDKTSLVCII